MQSAWNRGRSIALAALLALGASPACDSSRADSVPPKPTSTPASPPARAADAPQWYQASLNFGTALPPLNFFLALPARAPGKAIVVNGEERIEMAYEASGKRVRLVADWTYENEIAADRVGNRLNGQWRRYTPFWGDVVLGFEARPVSGPSPEMRYEGPPAATSVDGLWDLTFETHGDGRAQLSQKGDVVTGTARPGNFSDIRFLAGNLRGHTLLLSTFNGNAAYLATAEVSSDGKSMTGTMSLLNVWNEKFTGRRVEAMPAVKPPRLRDGATALHLPALERIEGRPALVVFFATWCPSCNEAMPFVVDLARRFRPKGVQVIGLNYELSEDEAATERQLARFRAKYGIDFELVQVPTTPSKWPEAMPPELEGWDGMPIFVFMGADGIVRHVVGGWWSRAAPERNRELHEQFEKWMTELVPR